MLIAGSDVHLVNVERPKRQGSCRGDTSGNPEFLSDDVCGATGNDSKW